MTLKRDLFSVFLASCEFRFPISSLARLLLDPRVAYSLASDENNGAANASCPLHLR